MLRSPLEPVAPVSGLGPDGFLPEFWGDLSAATGDCLFVVSGMIINMCSRECKDLPCQTQDYPLLPRQRDQHMLVVDRFVKGSWVPWEGVVVPMAPHWKSLADVEDLEKRCPIERCGCHSAHCDPWSMNYRESGSSGLHMRLVQVVQFVVRSPDPSEKRFERSEKVDHCNAGLLTPSEIGTAQLDLV